MRILIGIPCMDEMDTAFVKSLVSLRPVGLTDIHFEECSLVYLSRERIAARAVIEKWDYVLWLDSDMTFETSLLENLLADDKDIVTGLAFQRRPDYEPCIWSKIRLNLGEEKDTIERYNDYPQDECFKVEGCGLAACLMKVEVLAAVKERYGMAFEPISGYGEDLSFIIKARACGYEAYCDSRVKLGHMAKTPVSEETYKALNNRKA